MFRRSSFLAVIWGFSTVGLLAAQSDSKLPTFAGTVMTDEFKVQGGTFDVISDKDEKRTFEYTPRCVFYDKKAGRNLQPHQMGLGDEVIVTFKKDKDQLYAVKVTRTKAAKHD
jgi:hypothetical protein